MVTEILKAPGFLYQISGKYYYLGKWICKECDDIAATDCVVMYEMCRMGQEEPDTNMYFQKIRAHADFALEIPYNPVKIKADIENIVNNLSEDQASRLQKQFANFREDLEKYCEQTF